MRRTALKALKSGFFVAVKTNATPSFTKPNRANGRCALEAMRRELVWIERQDFWGWGCSKCAWVFSMAGSPIGESIDEMRKHYEQRRDKEFASHVCVEHPRAKNPKR